MSKQFELNKNTVSDHAPPSGIALPSSSTNNNLSSYEYLSTRLQSNFQNSTIRFLEVYENLIGGSTQAFLSLSNEINKGKSLESSLGASWEEFVKHVNQTAIKYNNDYSELGYVSVLGKKQTNFSLDILLAVNPIGLVIGTVSDVGIGIVSDSIDVSLKKYAEIKYARSIDWNEYHQLLEKDIILKAGKSFANISLGLIVLYSISSGNASVLNSSKFLEFTKTLMIPSLMAGMNALGQELIKENEFSTSSILENFSHGFMASAAFCIGMKGFQTIGVKALSGYRPGQLQEIASTFGNASAQKILTSINRMNFVNRWMIEQPDALRDLSSVVKQVSEIEQMTASNFLGAVLLGLSSYLDLKGGDGTRILNSKELVDARQKQLSESIELSKIDDSQVDDLPLLPALGKRRGSRDFPNPSDKIIDKVVTFNSDFHERTYTFREVFALAQTVHYSPAANKEIYLLELDQEQADLLHEVLVLGTRMRRLNAKPETFFTTDLVELADAIVTFNGENTDRVLKIEKCLTAPSIKKLQRARQVLLRDDVLKPEFVGRYFGFKQEGVGMMITTQFAESGYRLKTKKMGGDHKPSKVITAEQFKQFCREYGLQSSISKTVTAFWNKPVTEFIEQIRKNPYVVNTIADQILDKPLGFVARNARETGELEAFCFRGNTTKKIQLSSVANYLEKRGKKYEAEVLRKLAPEFYNEPQAALEEYKRRIALPPKSLDPTKAGNVSIRIDELTSLFGFGVGGSNTAFVNNFRDLCAKKAVKVDKVLLSAKGSRKKSYHYFITVDNLIKLFTECQLDFRAADLESVKAKLISGDLPLTDLTKAINDVVRKNPVMPSSFAAVILNLSKDKVTLEAQANKLRGLIWGAKAKTAFKRKYTFVDVLVYLEETMGQSELARAIKARVGDFVVQSRAEIDAKNLVRVVNECRSKLDMPEIRDSIVRQAARRPSRKPSAFVGSLSAQSTQLQKATTHNTLVRLRVKLFQLAEVGVINEDEIPAMLRLVKAKIKRSSPSRILKYQRMHDLRLDFYRETLDAGEGKRKRKIYDLSQRVLAYYSEEHDVISLPTFEALLASSELDSYSPRVQRLFLKFLLFHEECHRRQRAEQKRTGQKLDVVAKEAQAWFETAKEALRFGIRIVFSEDGPKLVEFETAEDVFSRISQRATVNNEIEELQRQEFFPNFMEITNWVRQNYFN